jgi:hypothetical protein
VVLAPSTETIVARGSRDAVGSAEPNRLEQPSDVATHSTPTVTTRGKKE